MTIADSEGCHTVGRFLFVSKRASFIMCSLQVISAKRKTHFKTTTFLAFSPCPVINVKALVVFSLNSATYSVGWRAKLAALRNPFQISDLSPIGTTKD